MALFGMDLELGGTNAVYKRDPNYDETDWRMMELAYVRACEILRVDPGFYAYRNE